MSENNQQEQPNDEFSETHDFNNPDYSFMPNGNHIYRQQGPYLVCNSCELQHAVFVGIDKVMTGVDDHGRPILTKR